MHEQNEPNLPQWMKGLNNSTLSLDLHRDLNPNTTSSDINTSMYDYDASAWEGGVVMTEGAKAGVIALYTLTSVLAVVGNVIVIITFTRGRRCRTDIRPFLINLAMADLIMAVFCMPFTFTFVMLNTWIFSKPMCPLVLFMQHLSVSGSVLTNTAIAFHRLLVVVFPLRSRVMTSRVKCVLMAIWACALAVSAVQWVVGRANEWPDGAVTCDEVWGSQEARQTFTLLVLFLTYIIPLSIVAVAYGVVGVVLWTRATPGNANQTRDTQQLQAKRKVVKMCVVVVVALGVCWLPLHTFFFLLDFRPDVLAYHTLQEERLFVAVFYCVHWLAMFSSCLNPLIYSFTNDCFRTDLVDVFQAIFSFCSRLKKLTNRHRLSVSSPDPGSSVRLRMAKSASGYGFGGFQDTNSSQGSTRRMKNRHRMYLCLNKDRPAANNRSPTTQCVDPSPCSDRSPLKTTTTCV